MFNMSNIIEAIFGVLFQMEKASESGDRETLDVLNKNAKALFSHMRVVGLHMARNTDDSRKKPFYMKEYYDSRRRGQYFRQYDHVRFGCYQRFTPAFDMFADTRRQPR